MPANHPSPIGKRATEAGYTLVELLVVLAVMGLLLAAAPVLIKAARPGIEAKAAVRMLANDLRAARATAVANNRETWVILDAPANFYAIEPDGGGRKLPDGVSLEFRGPRGDAAGKRIVLRFYPDGSSTGGSVGIASRGRQYWIADHWLTGRISIHE